MNKDQEPSLKFKQIRVGQTVFKQTVDQKLFEEQEINKSLKSQLWKINCGTYNYYKWKQVFQQMLKSNALTISLDHNGNSDIIKQISSVSFIQLKQLFLDGNRINNIQLLSQIDFQCLQFFSLKQNNITNIKCLNKLKNSTLKSFWQNPIQERISLNKAKINQAITYLYYQNSSYYQTQINQDLSQIVKLNCTQVLELWTKSYQRIRQYKVNNMLKLRFLSIIILLSPSEQD